MAVAGSLRERVRARPRTVTAVLSVLAYALVFGTFAGVVPIYPELGESAVTLFAHLIAAINATALVALLLGVRYVKRGEIDRHRRAMLTAFALILLFLVVYLWKIGGGYERSIVAPLAVKAVYLPMLAIHVALSALSVPLVVHAVVLGLTHAPAELPETEHPRVGRIAVAAWATSLFLGLVTYLLLNVVFHGVPRGEAALLALAVTGLDRHDRPAASGRASGRPAGRVSSKH